MKYNITFYLQNQKSSSNGANQYEPGIARVRIATDYAQPGSHRMSSNERERVSIPRFAPCVRPAQLEP